MKKGRSIVLGPGLAAIPEDLLLAHARGEVLFIVGAGVSRPAGLPDFRGLVLKIFEKQDGPVHAVMSLVPPDANNQYQPVNWSNLDNYRKAQIKRFINGDYDVVLGMLERNMEGLGRPEKSQVRKLVSQELLNAPHGPAGIHLALMRLANQRGQSTIATTNFDRLLEQAAKKLRMKTQTYSLGEIPRPERSIRFNGIHHIHGVLDPNPNRYSDLVLTDEDFGEFYLKRRVIPDFIYDAARLFNLVLVGYSANDPPMRYLLNAVSADGSRYTDLKTRYAFVGDDVPDFEIVLEDWRSRGITPIPYDAGAQHTHTALSGTLEAWASISASINNRRKISARIKRIVRTQRANTEDSERDLFDHIFRRSDFTEREQIAELVSRNKADLAYLDAMVSIAAESKFNDK